MGPRTAVLLGFACGAAMVLAGLAFLATTPLIWNWIPT